MRSAPLITRPPDPPGGGAGGPAAAPAQGAAATPATPMDRDFVIRNQIAERYLAGRLPVRGAQDFERFCRQHPELLDEIGLTAQVHAGLRLLEAGGVSAPWEEQPRRWWERLPTLIVIAGIGLLSLIIAIVLYSRISSRDAAIHALEARVAEQPLDPATSTRTVRLIPSRTAPSRNPAVTLGGSDAQMSDLKIDVSWSRYTAFRVTLDRLDQGRVAVVNYMLRDSNGDLRVAFNSSALGPGTYQFAIEGIGIHGETVPQAWVSVGLVH